MCINGIGGKWNGVMGKQSYCLSGLKRQKMYEPSFPCRINARRLKVKEKQTFAQISEDHSIFFVFHIHCSIII